MIIDIETDFDVQNGKEIRHRYEISEDEVKNIVMERLLEQTYTERKKFLEYVGAEKIS